MTLLEQLENMDACPEALYWAQGKTVEQAWATCERAEWMLWYAHRRDVPTPALCFAVNACLKCVKPNDNDFAREGFKDAKVFASEVLANGRRAEHAIYTALRCEWGRLEYPTEGYAVSDDNSTYSADRAALNKVFADIVRAYIPVGWLQ